MTNPNNSPQARQGMVRIVLLKVLLPLAILGAIIITITVLQLDGTLREFLDRQSIFGMIVIVLVINIIGFGFICLLMTVWQSIRHDLSHLRDH